MWFLIIAQAARAAVIWTTNRLAQKILKTLTVTAVGLYLVDKVKRQKYLDEKRGYNSYTESERIEGKNESLPERTR
jgi:hypothetical protein